MQKNLRLIYIGEFIDIDKYIFFFFHMGLIIKKQNHSVRFFLSGSGVSPPTLLGKA